MKKNQSPDQSWTKYMGLTGQIFGSALMMLVVGWQIDKWMEPAQPLFIWVLPLIMIILILIKLVIDTNKKADDSEAHP